MASMLFLGFSIVMFLVSYGVTFLIAPTVFNSIYAIFDPMWDNTPDSNGWKIMYENNKEIVQFFIPLMLLLSVFLAVIKVLMSATTKGSDS